MSKLTNLQADIAGYKRDADIASRLTRLRLNPDYKEIVELGLQQLATNTVAGLASTTGTERDEAYTALLGISVFQRYLENVVLAGEVAEIRVQQAQFEINHIVQGE